MIKSQMFKEWWYAQPLVRRLATKDWSLGTVDRGRELVLLAIPIAAMLLVVSSCAGYALTPAPAPAASDVSALSTQEFDSAVEPVEPVDPLVASIEKWGEPDLAAILNEEFPGSQWSLNGNTYAGLVWIGPGAKPSEETLLGLWNKVGQALADRQVVAEEEAAEKAAEQKAQEETRAADPTRQDLCRSIDYKALYGPGVDYTKVLALHYPGAQWTLNGDAYSGLTWISPGTKPSKATLDSLWDGVAFGLCLQKPLSELSARAGTSETEEYVNGVARPKGFSDGSFQPSLANCNQLPQIPNTNGGSPAGSIDIYKDPTGSQNFEQLYGMGLGDLGCRIAQAHGWFGGQYSLGLGLSGDRTLMWYSNQVDSNTVRGVLDGIGALRSNDPAPEPTPEPE